MSTSGTRVLEVRVCFWSGFHISAKYGFRFIGRVSFLKLGFSGLSGPDPTLTSSEIGLASSEFDVRFWNSWLVIFKNPRLLQFWAQLYKFWDSLDLVHCIRQNGSFVLQYKLFSKMHFIHHYASQCRNYGNIHWLLPCAR